MKEIQNDTLRDILAKTFGWNICSQDLLGSANANINDEGAISIVDKDLSAAANRYIQEFEARSDMAEDGAAININEDIDPISADDSFDELLGSLQEFEQEDAWRDVVKDVLDRTEFYYTSEDEKGRDFAKTIWETVKTKILVNRTLNPEWQAVMRKGGAEKEEWLQEEIKNVYTAEVVTQAGATKVKKPTKEQQQLGSQEHADYIAGVAKTAQETFDKYARKNKKLKISSTMVVAGAGNAWAKLKGFIDFSEAKQLGENFIGKVKNYRDSFDAKMELRHPKLWGWAKTIAEHAKASKWQTITGLAFTGAVIVTGAGAGMLTAYAAYMGVSSWIWPIANKKALELNRAKKSGNEETIALWKGGEGWNRAMTSIFYNKRETKNYILKGTIGTIFAGVAGYLANNTELAAGLFGNSEAMNKASDVTKGMIIRTQQAIIRSVGAVTGQFSTWLGDGISYLRDKTEENKAYFKQSSIGLGLAGLLAGGATWWQLHNLHGLENTAVAEGLVVGNAAPKDLPEGAKLLAETDKGGRAYQLGNRVIFEENGKVAHNIDKSAFDNYKGDTSNEDYAAKVLAHDEAKQAEAAQKAAAKAAAAAAEVSPEVQENEALIYFFGKDENGNAFVPTEYSENLGIKKSEWDFMEEVAPGWLSDSDNAAHVGSTAGDFNTITEQYIRNYAVYMYQHKDQFPSDYSPYKLYHDFLRRLVFSAGNIHSDGDTHSIAEKFQWIVDNNGNEIQVSNTQWVKVGDKMFKVDHKNIQFDGEQAIINGKTVNVDEVYVSIKGEKVKLDGNFVEFNGERVRVNREWRFGDPSYNNDMNALAEIGCDGSTSRSNFDPMAPLTKLNKQLNDALQDPNSNHRAAIAVKDCGPNKERIVYVEGKKVKVRVPDAPAEQPTTREVLNETQQVVEAPTTREIINEDTKPVENNEYVVRKVRYVNKGNADTQLGDQDLNGHIKGKGSYTIAGKGESR